MWNTTLLPFQPGALTTATVIREVSGWARSQHDKSTVVRVFIRRSPDPRHLDTCAAYVSMRENQIE
jgi:hypothetical protein